MGLYAGIDLHSTNNNSEEPGAVIPHVTPSA
jgi:hypothetical protein